MKNRKIQLVLIFLLGMFATGAYAQQEVTGVIRSDDGELLPGVSVVIKGTLIGVTSDFDGNYAIKSQNPQSVFVFSYLGMEAQEITVGNRSSIDVVMKSSSEQLDEVVVTALGISREKKSLGYSISEVSGDALDKVPRENVINGLAGKVSGVSINSTGTAGSSVSMVIRGATSLSSDNQPLFVVDGTPVFNTINNVGGVGSNNNVDYGNAISDLNADDIASVTVLKGASAAALYGSRAGNGVVLVTTKSGKAKKGLGISINSSTVFDIPTTYLDTQKTYAAGSRPYTNDNFPPNAYGNILIGENGSAWAGPALDQGVMAIQWPYSSQELASGIPVARELKSYDNAKNFFNTAITTSNNISIQDNNERMNYRLSYSGMENKGFIPNTDLNKHAISLNSTLRLNKALSVSTSLNYAKSFSDNRAAGNRGANPIQAMYETSPHIDVSNMTDYWLPGYEGLYQNSPYQWGDDPTESTEWNNPYFLANEVTNSFMRNRFYGNVKADWQITDDFSAFVRYNFDEINENRETKISNGYTNEMNGAYGLTNIFRNEVNIDYLLTYAKKYNDWDFTVSFGGNQRKYKSTSTTNQTKNGGQGLLIPNLFTLYNIAPDNLYYNNYAEEKQVNSLYGLASIGFKNMIYVDVTGRNDWSSTLPDDNNSYFYPSVSGSLLLNNMFEMGQKISLVKLRGGYAEVGNDTDPYNLDAVLNNQGTWGRGLMLSVPSGLLNPNLKPESQESWEVGADLAFFQNRLSLSGTYYVSNNRDQIFPVQSPISSGYSSQLINAGLLTNKGWEGSLNGTIIQNSNWHWDMGFVFTKNRTTVEELPEGLDRIDFWSDAKGGASTWIGEEVGTIYDRSMVRVDDVDSPYYGWPLLDGGGWEDSDSQIQDEDGNRIAPIIGNFNPNFILGMTTSVAYKNWSLSMNFDWRNGGQFVSQTHRYGESDMHTQRWLDKIHDLSDVGDVPTYLKDNADQYLSPDGEFFVLVGGPTAETGGYELDEGGITLNDGVFMPGVIGEYDDNGNFIAERENLGGEGTSIIRYQDYYGWNYTKVATFDADFIKLREISLTYNIPSIRLQQIGIQNMAVSLFSRNIMIWNKAQIGIDPEMAFQPESSEQGRSGMQFKQGIERFNVNPWAVPVGFKVSFSF